MFKGAIGVLGATLALSTACAVDGTRGADESIGAKALAYGSCAGLASWDSSNWQFTVAAGDVIEHLGRAYLANVTVMYANAECAPDNPASWCASWFTDLGPCEASSEGDAETPAAESSIPQECYANGMIDMMCAELAVSMAREIGELNPLRDLEVSNNRVVLSAEGMSRCSNGCETTRAILSLQDTSVNEVIDQSVFSATTFRTNLVTQYYEQQNYEYDLLANQPDLLPDSYSLTLTGTSPAYCGTNYEFHVNWQCAGEPKLVSQGTCTKDPSVIENRMRFFRPNNTVIDFLASTDTVSIDPTGSLNGDGETTASGCHDACMKYGSSYLGDCCNCNGYQGEYVYSPGSRNLMLCDY